MTLSKPVYIDGTKITLLDRGVTLDDDKIEMLKKIGVSGAFVYGSADSVSAPVPPPRETPAPPSPPHPAVPPAAATAAPPAPQPPAPAPPQAEKKNRDFKVLVVDDEKDICIYVKDVLENYQYDVAMTTSGLEAIEMIKKDPSINVLFLDIMMPEMNGFEVLKRVRGEARRNIQVVMITARRTMQDVLMAKELGVIGYVTKPFDPERLVKVLENAISLRAS